MAPGNNGGSTTPEDEDPFGYLYADGQAAGATPPNGGGGGYGYPNSRSFHQVRTVGERQYGQQQVPPQQTQPTQAYHQPNAHYQAPETMPGGGAPTQPGQPRSSRGGGGRGPNTKALLIGAVAVVAAVVIGISVAMMSNSSDDDKNADAGGKPSGDSQSVQPSESASPSASASEAAADLPKTDAKSVTLGGGTAVASDVQGAKADGGQYVAGFNKVGASITWTVNNIPDDGEYRLYVNYGVPGKAQDATIDVNGKKQSRPLNMNNFAHAKEGDWEHGWTNTWASVQLTKGTNAITVSCQDGNKCDANFDQFWLTGKNG
ncbi:carbohydrate-binding protein [Streptomyces sp. NPDC046716]|uniref:carbohydrate-binding protein n=1 Tax=Streptomyces sp. NPDC046716 TaxID=3157093 RepID=UPI0033DE6CC8